MDSVYLLEGGALTALVVIFQQKDRINDSITYGILTYNLFDTAIDFNCILV